MTVTNTQLAIGIDIGGTNTKFGLVNHEAKILEEGVLKTGEYPTIDAFTEALYTNLKPIIDKYQADYTIKGIGVGAPNGNFYNGCIEHAPNLHWKGVVPVRDMISQKFNLPCSLTNDANAAAGGELKYGAAKGMKDFIQITLGTGVGSGIVVDGEILYGHNGIAGELGHTIIRPGGRKHWSTGLHGTLESYCSATGIVITAKEFLAQNPDRPSLLRDVAEDKIEAKTVNECAVKGDELANEIYQYTGQILGEALANFVMFSSPEAIILFGGVTKAGDLLLKPAKEHMEKNLLQSFKDQVPIMLSQLKEADAAILGASSLV
ncbi:ROK family protein [Mucilaginibacter sp. Bleaf8]|uniref:ROK family protein n=1 Tax=Mucilaginibacter sp. Bleaf8 TaxID=2834430 RepID=UPI001BCF1A3B|nr:ROK family protein [Mucilaginibacter sp. Bleaf8]MBS7563936.1 ROK family protein [Mucilaginibacter sp. Bleaf8]